MSHSVTVLYEDSRTAATSRFLLHELALRCIRDQPHRAQDWALERRCLAVPHNGADKLLARLAPDKLQRLRSGGAFVIACLDSDKLHHRPQLGLGPEPSDAQAKSAIVRFTGAAEVDFELVLLRRNLESLLEVVAQVLQRPAPERKDHQTRDLLLQAACAASAAQRRTIQDLMPSFGALVGLIDRLDAAKEGPAGLGAQPPVTP